MLKDFEAALDTCTYCPKMCTFSCPVSTVEMNEMTSPWGKMQAANLVLKGMLPLTEETAALAYKCTTCKLCQEYCEHDVDVASTLLEVRKMAVKAHVEPPEIAGFLDKFHVFNNPFGKDLLKTLDALVPEKYRNPNAETVYLATCATISKTPEVIQDTLSLFDKLGIDNVAVFMDPLQCCGHPLLTGGVENEFEDLAELMYQALRRFRNVIVASPSCAYTLKKTYADYHFNLGSRVMTMPQFLKPYLANTNFVLEKKSHPRVMYQDPCYLGRYLGDYDTPRELIEMTTSRPPIEFHENREYSQCCGQGGCYSVTSPEASNEISVRRLDEVRERHIRTVVTHCPSCTHKLRKNAEDITVIDLVTLLNEVIDAP